LPSRFVSMAEQPPDEESSLAARFAEEQRRRADEQPAEEAFSGIKEIVLDSDGKPLAIPRRPPPPASTQREEVAGLLDNPLFYFGVAISVGSLALLLAIAAADDNALL
jgi:hypothetical protein